MARTKQHEACDYIPELQQTLLLCNSALVAARRHLIACEAGRIRHPFKSASLPVVDAAIELSREILKDAGFDI